MTQRDYVVTLKVELAEGEPRRLGEYGWSTGITVAVNPEGCYAANWLPETLTHRLLQYLKNAAEDQAAYDRSNKWWRRLFRG